MQLDIEVKYFEAVRQCWICKIHSVHECLQKLCESNVCLEVWRKKL